MSLVRRHAYARSGPEAARAALDLAAAGSGPHTNLAPWRSHPALILRADRLRAALCRRLPASRAAHLRVEVGVVEVEGVISGARRWPYAVALSDLTLVACHTPLARNGRLRDHTTWAGDCNALAPGAPLTLAPSAVLALALHLLDSTRESETPDRLGPLRIRHTQTCPYPPQHHPWTADGQSAVDLSAGDLSFQLFARLDNWATPLNSLYGARRGNIALTDRRRPVRLRRPHVRLEGLEALGAPSPGGVEWRCDWSWIDDMGRSWSSAEGMTLRFDAARLLSAARGPLGPAAPACRRDPIEGDAWGTAPPLATSLTVEGLLQ